jgi:hypothetical protein
MTFLAAFRHDRIYGPFLLNEPVNRETFLIYVRNVLAPTLSPGDIVSPTTWRVTNTRMSAVLSAPACSCSRNTQRI